MTFEGNRGKHIEDLDKLFEIESELKRKNANTTVIEMIIRKKIVIKAMD